MKRIPRGAPAKGCPAKGSWGDGFVIENEPVYYDEEISYDYSSNGSKQSKDFIFPDKERFDSNSTSASRYKIASSCPYFSKYNNHCKISSGNKYCSILRDIKDKNCFKQNPHCINNNNKPKKHIHIINADKKILYVLVYNKNTIYSADKNIKPCLIKTKDIFTNKDIQIKGLYYPTSSIYYIAYDDLAYYLQIEIAPKLFLKPNHTFYQSNTTFADKSIMSMYGYKVGKNGLNIQKRHRIIDFLIENNIQNQYEIFDFLQKQIYLRIDSLQFSQAIADWEEDISYIKEQYIKHDSYFYNILH